MISFKFKPRARLQRTIGPVEKVLGATGTTLLADLTDVSRGEGIVMLLNVDGTNTAYFCLSTSATTPPALTTANGIPLQPSGGGVILDNVGGMAIWGVCSAAQSAGNGVRVSGGKP